MEEMLTVNIQMKIPVKRDSVGRRIGIMNLLQPYVDAAYGQMIELPEYDQLSDFDYVERMECADKDPINIQHRKDCMRSFSALAQQ
jgi:hypothetical protein